MIKARAVAPSIRVECVPLNVHTEVLTLQPQHVRPLGGPVQCETQATRSQTVTSQRERETGRSHLLFQVPASTGEAECVLRT